MSYTFILARLFPSSALALHRAADADLEEYSTACKGVHGVLRRTLYSMERQEHFGHAWAEDMGRELGLW